MDQKITLTVEYLPGKYNVRAGWEYQNDVGSSNWKLDLHRLTLTRFQPEIDLFVTRLICLIPKYYLWKPDPNSLKTVAFQQSWEELKGYVFPFYL